MQKVPASCATIGFASPTRLLRSTWCPDKDLLVVVIRVAGKDKLGLWNMSGSKKWEVDIEKESANGQEIVDIAWSPDGSSYVSRKIQPSYELNSNVIGQYIAVASNPPLVTLHSLQDGQQERTLSIASNPSGDNKLTGIWWLREYRAEKKASIPDMFKRGGDIVSAVTVVFIPHPKRHTHPKTGSAHAILKTQPLLDALHEPQSLS